MNPNEIEKLPRVQTAHAGIYYVNDPTQPMFPVVLRDALAELYRIPTGKNLVDEIVGSSPGVNRGFKVVIHRVDVAYRIVETDKNEIGYESKQQGGRAYASAVCDERGVRVTDEANGTGASAVVGWCPNILRVNDHQRKTKTWIPMSITLGHELIHALHCLKGVSKSGHQITIGSKAVSEEEAQ